MKLEFLHGTDRLGDPMTVTLIRKEDGDTVRIHCHLWGSVACDRIVEPVVSAVGNQVRRMVAFFSRKNKKNNRESQAASGRIRQRRRREIVSKVFGVIASVLCFPWKRLLPYSGEGLTMCNIGQKDCFAVDLSSDDRFVSIFSVEIALSWRKAEGGMLAWLDESFPALPHRSVPCRVFSGCGTVISIVGLEWAEKTVGSGESFSISPYLVIAYLSRKDFRPVRENGRIVFPEHSRVWYITESEVARARRGTGTKEGAVQHPGDIGNVYPSVVRS